MASSRKRLAHRWVLIEMNQFLMMLKLNEVAQIPEVRSVKVHSPTSRRSFAKPPKLSISTLRRQRTFAQGQDEVMILWRMLESHQINFNFEHLQLHFDCLRNFMVIFHETNYICPFYFAQEKLRRRKSKCVTMPRSHDLWDHHRAYNVSLNDFIVNNLKYEWSHSALKLWFFAVCLVISLGDNCK